MVRSSTRDETTGPVPGDRSESIPRWSDYARQDRREVSPYLFERGERRFEGEGLDAVRYTSQAIHDLEVKHIWLKVWQVACRVNDVPNPGDFVEYSIAGRSVIVVRDADGAIGAFHNSCQHRGTRLADGCGTTSCFVCPYHGWIYGLDGAIEKIPARWDFGSFCESELRLRSVRAETFDGWVFINFDPDASPLEDHLGPTVARHLLVQPSAGHWKSAHYGKVVRSNWKVIAEAFFETYHAARTHPETNAFGPDVQTEYDVFGEHNRMRIPMLVSSLEAGGSYTEEEIFEEAISFMVDPSLAGDGPATDDGGITLPEGVTARQMMADLVRMMWTINGVDLDDVSDAELLDVIQYFVFPNLSTDRNPSGHWSFRYRPNGNDPTSSIFEFFKLVPLNPQAPKPRDTPLQMIPEDQPFADCEDLGRPGYIVDQDVANATRIQKGLSGLEQSHLGREQEYSVLAFNGAIDSRIERGQSASSVCSEP